MLSHFRIRLFCRTVLVIGAFWAIPMLALDPKRSITQYGYDTWTQRSGFHREAARSIVQTADGYLWLATSGGLMRFDGVQFVRVEQDDAGQVLNESVRAIALSPGGGLLVRTRTHTFLEADGRFHELGAPAALPDGSPECVLRSSDGRLWIGADNHVYLLTPGGGFTKLISRCGWVAAMHEDRNGAVWFATGGGLYRFYRNRLTIIPSDARAKFTTFACPFDDAQNAYWRGEPPTSGSVLALAEDRDGSLWIGTSKGLFRMADGHLESDPLTTVLAGKAVNALHVDRDGNVWAGTAIGLFRHANGRWTTLPPTSSLASRTVLSLAEDREGSLWIGTDSGLDRLRDTKLVTLTTNDGLAGNATSSVAQTNDGDIWIWSDGGGLTRLREGKATVYTVADGLASNTAGTLYPARDGSLWIGSRVGLSHFQNGKITAYRGEGKLSNVFISAVCEDDESLIVATSALQLYRFRDGALTPYTLEGKSTPFTAPGAYFFTAYRDRKGTLWFGLATGNPTPGGLYRAEGGKVVRQKEIGFSVNSVYDDGQGSLWLTGSEPGITRFDPATGKVTRYTRQQGLYDNDVICVLSDAQENLWMSSARGIFSVSRSDLDGFRAGHIAAVRCTAYDVDDGMISAETSVRRQQSGCRTADGRLWFSTRAGVTVVNPEHLPQNTLSPPVRIEGFVADHAAPQVNSGVRLAPGLHNIEIHYTALSFLVPERVHFRYKLEGHDSEWIDAQARRVAYYSQLPPGNYRFRVIAANEDGVWNEEGATFAFAQAPHFYQTTWYRIACLAVGLSGIIALHKIRVRHLRAREKLLQRVVEERTQSLKAEIVVRERAEREAERIHKELMIASHQAGMAEVATGVLHNVGNVLNSANVSLTLISDKVRASKVASLAKVSDLVRAHQGDLSAFITTDARGQKLPEYLLRVTDQLVEEQRTIDAELSSLRSNMEHIKEIVAMQQAYAQVVGAAEPAAVVELVEDALHMNAAGLAGNDVQVVREFQDVPRITVEKHKVLQILVNLIQNAKRACDDANRPDKRIIIGIRDVAEKIEIAVTDNGVGIAVENLTPIFGHGFNMRKDGHGFGLHSGILAAKALGGTITAASAGIGQGATFTLVLPKQPLTSPTDRNGLPVDTGLG